MISNRGLTVKSSEQQRINLVASIDVSIIQDVSEMYLLIPDVDVNKDKILTSGKYCIVNSMISVKILHVFTIVITDNFHHLLMKFHIHVWTYFYIPSDKN